MKTRRWLAFAPALLLASASFAQETLQVQLREATLRASASSLAQPVAVAKLGDSLTVEQRAGSWIRVRTAAGETGWVHESAVTRRRIQWRAGEETVAARASVGEVALATKGFSEQIEQEYRKTKKDADYSTVDRVERKAVPPERLIAFLREGGLKIPGGEP